MKLKSFLIATWAASEGYSNNNLGKSVYLFTLVKFSHFPKCFGEIRPRHVLCKIHPHILNCWSLFEKSISNLEAISGSLEMKRQCGPAVFNINSTCDLFGTKHMCGKKNNLTVKMHILHTGFLWLIFWMLAGLYSWCCDREQNVRLRSGMQMLWHRSHLYKNDHRLVFWSEHARYLNTYIALFSHFLPNSDWKIKSCGISSTSKTCSESVFFVVVVTLLTFYFSSAWSLTMQRRDVSIC